MPIPSSMLRSAVLSVSLALGGCAGERAFPAYEAPEDIEHAEEYQVRDEGTGTRLFGQSWLPREQALRALLLLVHGTAEHSGLYAPLAEALARHGVGVYGIDMQGWGRSDGPGERGFIDSHETYIGDVAQTAARLRARFPDVPIYGVGESLGGAVLLRGQLSGALSLDGLMLSDAAYKPHLAIPYLGVRPPKLINDLSIWVGSTLGALLPHLPLLHTDVGMGAALCASSTRDRFARDPHVAHGWLPAAYVSTIYESFQVIDADLERLSVPVLAIHGDDDMLLPVESSREIVERAPNPHNRLLVIEGGCHASLVEADSWQPAMAAMLQLIDELQAERDAPLDGASAEQAHAALPTVPLAHD